jgi:hypothetical protein
MRDHRMEGQVRGFGRRRPRSARLSPRTASCRPHWQQGLAAPE